MKRLAALLLIFPAIGCSNTPQPTSHTSTCTFHNPIIPHDSPDPWIIRHEGFYYFTATLDVFGGVWIWKSPTITGLGSAEKVKVWTAPTSGPASKQIWAPELHRLDGKWYIYFTATDGPDKNHRHYILEADTDNPLGSYTFRGQLDPDLDSYAIDGSILTLPDSRRYWLYTTGKLFIAPMLSPTKIDGSRRVEICRATYPWERGWVEAPEALIHNGRVFLAYSAGHSGTPHYSLGLLSLKPNSDPLDPKSWTKSSTAVFAPYFGPDGAAYNVGHNTFTRSPDGSEDWILYHAKDWRTDEAKDRGFNGRNTRAQPFTWNPDGTPNFGHPIPSEVPVPIPSGE